MDARADDAGNDDEAAAGAGNTELNNAALVADWCCAR